MVWPPQPTYDNPIVGLCSNNSVDASTMNFIDKYGHSCNQDKSNQCTFDPDQVGKVVMAFNTNHSFSLHHLELFDKDGRSICQVGATNNLTQKYTVEMKEGERFIGIASHATYNNCYHFNIQLIIASQ